LRMCDLSDCSVSPDCLVFFRAIFWFTDFAPLFYPDIAVQAGVCTRGLVPNTRLRIAGCPFSIENVLILSGMSHIGVNQVSKKCKEEAVRGR
jgi:hypothetical protein